MRPKLPKIFTIFFILFIILQISSFLFLNLFCLPVQAIGIGQSCDPANDQCDPPLKCDPDLKLCAMVVESTRLNDSKAEWEIPDLQISIPTVELTEARPCPHPDEDKMCVPWIGQYIAGIYKYAIGIVGILATVVMMIGGIMWIVAGGNATRVGEAKAWIGASLTGLVLALTSYTILYQINPKLTQFKPIEVAKVEKIISGCCIANEKAYSPTTKKECDDKSGKWHENKTKYNPPNDSDPEQCLTQAEIDALKFCCIRTDSKGIVTCADKIKGQCETNPSKLPPGVVQIPMAKKCAAYPSKCESSISCVGLSEGVQCGDGKMCVDKGGALKCEECRKNAYEPCGLTTDGIQCCTYLGLKCQNGQCTGDPTIDCTLAENDNKACGTEKVCYKNECKNCEPKIDGWCTIAICCAGMCCDSSTWPDSCQAGTPLNGKYCN